MVVMGNPPYSVESANRGEWITRLMKDYKKEPGGKEGLKEKNPKAINDDYVKFIRYGQHFIKKNGSGVLAYICPHGFLDNITFRGMRWNLLKTYDKIYTINLHGNIKKKKVCPDESVDENVFVEIMQGVAITFFIKTGKKKENELAQVFHHDLSGTRESKYQFLTGNSISSTPYKKLPNVAPRYFMVPKDFKGEEEYTKGFSVRDFFSIALSGVSTKGDNFIIAKKRDELHERLVNFLENEVSEEQLKNEFSLGEDYPKWVIGNKSKISIDESKFVKFDYRPFDTRWTYFDQNLLMRWKHKVMKHFFKGENIGLVFNKPAQGGPDFFSDIYITKNITDQSIYSAMQRSPFISPLYLYPEIGPLALGGTAERTPNLKPKIVNEIAEKLGLTFTPEKTSPSGGEEFSPIDLLDYIYAVLHSPTYREKYQEFLKIAFPIVAYPKDKDTFWELAKLGGEIRELHLLESSALENSTVSYPQEGSDMVTCSSGKKDWELYEGGKLGRIRINEKQFFENIPLAAWEFYIGGYQPAQKWLKDREECKLSYDDIEHYQKIIVALTETGRVMSEIEEVYSPA